MRRRKRSGASWSIRGSSSIAARHVATTTAAEMPTLPAGAASAGSEKAEPGRGGGDRNRRHLALRRAWNDEHASATGPSSVRKRKCIEQGGRSGCGSVPSMVHNDGLPPLVTKCPLAEIRRATGLSTRYVIMIRKGLGIQPQETISILVAKRSKASIGLN